MDATAIAGRVLRGSRSRLAPAIQVAMRRLAGIASRGYRRFVIASFGRSGTNMLVERCNSHPQGAGLGPALRARLSGDRGLHVIVLRRRKLVDIYLSHRLAERSGEFILHEGSRAGPDPGPVGLDPEDCARFFRVPVVSEEIARHVFAGPVS